MTKIICPECGFRKEKKEKGMEFCPKNGTKLVIKRSRVKARDRTITPDEFLKAAERFDLTEYKISYEEARKFDWKNIHKMSLDDIKMKIIWFLNKWNALSKKWIEPSNELLRAIKETFSESLENILSLEGKCIENVDFKSTIKVGNENIETSKVIYRIFSSFSNIGLYFKEVAASKLLHQVNPELFVIWDTKIAKAYKISKNATGYSWYYMPLMKCKINQIIEHYKQDKSCSREEAIKELRYKGNTLAKMIHDFNWIEYSKARSLKDI